MAKTETYDTSQTKDSETEILTWSFTVNLEIRLYGLVKTLYFLPIVSTSVK